MNTLENTISAKQAIGACKVAREMLHGLLLSETVALMRLPDSQCSSDEGVRLYDRVVELGQWVDDLVEVIDGLEESFGLEGAGE